jgi:inorganic pyrophosphatase/exopolyphosphatase
MLYPGDAERRLVQRAFAPGQLGPESAELPGVVSRKQQVVPPIARALDGR